MAKNDNSGNGSTGESYDVVFALLGFGLLIATALVAVGGIYYNFIHPSF